MLTFLCEQTHDFLANEKLKLFQRWKKSCLPKTNVYISTFLCNKLWTSLHEKISILHYLVELLLPVLPAAPEDGYLREKARIIGRTPCEGAQSEVRKSFPLHPSGLLQGPRALQRGFLLFLFPPTRIAQPWLGQTEKKSWIFGAPKKKKPPFSRMLRGLPSGSFDQIIP